ncbi:uncharacterized protein M421DRAFT_204178 [Didymella exigua CBS 183.55]|uniref:Uncharacterized protein n=1 Tax=Didymella exigua CBS 183.55 TaxID=1150837 RepID=A0A6A5RZ76_9PLEO|nr:uncharacterized protein M421DRAFT_204178 [Didymella exigua CBS 183.55]KAF1933765.1 hypothetical protein M421DRAFT_204178 [Didymella exigua CBS 183.55]
MLACLRVTPLCRFRAAPRTDLDFHATALFCGLSGARCYLATIRVQCFLLRLCSRNFKHSPRDLFEGRALSKIVKDDSLREDSEDLVSVSEDLVSGSEISASAARDSLWSCITM